MTSGGRENMCEVYTLGHVQFFLHLFITSCFILLYSPLLWFQVLHFLPLCFPPPLIVFPTSPVFSLPCSEPDCLRTLMLSIFLTAQSLLDLVYVYWTFPFALPLQICLQALVGLPVHQTLCQVNFLLWILSLCLSHASESSA